MPPRSSSSPTRPTRCCPAGGRGGNNGQTAAAGKASVVRAHAVGGTGLTLIGTSPVFRLHAKGLQPQLGRALLWAAAPVSSAAATSVESTVGGTVPATLSLSLGAPASFGAVRARCRADLQREHDGEDRLDGR